MCIKYQVGIQRTSSHQIVLSSLPDVIQCSAAFFFHGCGAIAIGCCKILATFLSFNSNRYRLEFSRDKIISDATDKLRVLSALCRVIRYDTKTLYFDDEILTAVLAYRVTTRNSYLQELKNPEIALRWTIMG